MTSQKELLERRTTKAKKVDEEVKAKILQYMAKGWETSAIAARFGITRSYVTQVARAARMAAAEGAGGRQAP